MNKLIVGIINFESKSITLSKKQNKQLKPFIPILRHFDKKIMVNVANNMCTTQYAKPVIKKFVINGEHETCTLHSMNKYVVVIIENEHDDYIECNIYDNYIGSVGNYNDELKMITALTCCHWKSKKKCDQLIPINLIDLTPDRKVISNDTHIYSIDPIGCVDIDDAIHVHEFENNYEVGIHISDPTSFIQENSDLDKELFNRTSSTYLSTTNHMIPKLLSVGLNTPDKTNLSNSADSALSAERRAFSVIVTLDKGCNVINVVFQKTLITVTQNLSYEDAEKMIDTNDHIKLMYILGKKIKETMNNSFDPNEKYDTHQMIAIYMILANKLVAEAIVKYDKNNALLRTQESSITVNTLECDEQLGRKYRISQFKKAKYSLANDDQSSHSGLQLNNYTHFTSPMRRYADMIVHRQLYNVINNLPINKLSDKIIEHINEYTDFYRKVQRYFELVKISNMIENKYGGEIIVDAYIINFHGQSIRLFVKELELDYNYYVTNFDTIIDNEKMIIRTHKDKHQEKQNITLQLFQKIKIRLVCVFSKEKIMVEILDPLIY